MAELAEQRTHLRLGNRAVDAVHDRVHVVFLQLEGHAQFLQHHVVGDGQLQWLSGAAVILAALEEHQTIEEMCHQLVVAWGKAFFVFLLEHGREVAGSNLFAAELNDVDHLRVADVEGVAQAAQYVVVKHGKVLKRRQPKAAVKK